MKTWLTREGLYVSTKPKEPFIGKDAHGNNVFVGDMCRSKETKRIFKVLENDYFSNEYYISKSVKVIKHN